MRNKTERFLQQLYMGWFLCLLARGGISTNCKSSGFYALIETVHRGTRGMKRAVAHKGIINPIHKRRHKTTIRNTAENNNTIEVKSWNLTVVWFIFLNCLHFVLCVREKLEKRREIGLYSRQVKRR